MPSSIHLPCQQPLECSQICSPTARIRHRIELTRQTDVTSTCPSAQLREFRMRNSASSLRQIRAGVLELSSIMSVLYWRDRMRLLFCLLANVRPLLKQKRFYAAEQHFLAARRGLRVRTLGRNLLLPHPDLTLVRELYGRKIYFPSADFIPTTGSKVVDLGANFGFFSLLCASLGSEVVAVDAQSLFAAEARTAFELNGVSSNIRYINALLGSAVGEFASPKKRDAASHWADEPPEMSLSQVLGFFGDAPKDGSRDIHLLKVDIEGSEFSLFNNELNSLNRIAHISMEVHPHYGDADRLRKFLESAGFACQLRASWREDGIPKAYPGYLFATAVKSSDARARRHDASSGAQARLNSSGAE